MVASAFEFADVCRKHDYHNFVFSMKASNPLVMVQVGDERFFLRVGQNHLCTVCIQYFWQGTRQMYGHVQCIYWVLANPTDNLYQS